MSLYAISTGQFDGWVESGEIDAPKVAAVLVWGVRVGGRLVGAVDEVMVVAAESGVLDLEGAGGEPFDAGIAFGMDLIEVDPAVGLTVELDGGVGGEEEAGGSVGEVGKNAAGLVGWRREEGARGAGGEVRQLDGPGIGRDARGGELTGRNEGGMQPGELVAVGRECGSGVVAGGGIGEAESVGFEVVEREEAVRRLAGFAAMADEGEQVTVRGEGELRGRTAVEDELMRGRGGGGVGDPDLAFADEEEAVAVGREERRVTVTDEDGLGAGSEWLDDDFDGRGTLEMGRVRGLAVGSRLSAVGVGDGGRVGSPGQLGDVLRIVLGVVGEQTSDLVGAGNPEIVAAFCVLDPGEEVALRRGGEGGGVRRAENLL